MRTGEPTIGIIMAQIPERSEPMLDALRLRFALRAGLVIIAAAAVLVDLLDRKDVQADVFMRMVSDDARKQRENPIPVRMGAGLIVIVPKEGADKIDWLVDRYELTSLQAICAAVAVSYSLVQSGDRNAIAHFNTIASANYLQTDIPSELASRGGLLRERS